ILPTMPLATKLGPLHVGLGMQKAVVSNHEVLLPIPPSTWKGAICCGVCVVPGALSELPLAVKRSGLPVMNVRIPPTCHPPAIQLPHPDFRNGLPLPNGSS